MSDMDEKQVEAMVIDIIINFYMNNPDLYEKSENDYINKTAKMEKLEGVVQFLKSMNISITG